MSTDCPIRPRSIWLGGDRPRFRRIWDGRLRRSNWPCEGGIVPTMKIERLIALFPCHSLEAFDLNRQENDAEQLLAAWSAFWHPELLAAANAIPSWHPAVYPPEELSGCLVVVPDCCVQSLPDDWLAKAESAGASLLRGLHHRDDVVAAALSRLGPDRPAVDSELVADFLALGYGYLLVELLTRKFRYMSNLDVASVQTSALAGAEKALAGDAAAAKVHLQAAFDRLHEAREYLYPVEANLLDLTLVAPSTLGDALRAELATALPRSLLVSGSVIEEMARREPETLQTLAQSLAAGSVALVGGEFNEMALPLLNPEAIEQDIARGLAAYQEHLGQRPFVFGRRRFGLAPTLLQVLQRLGFTGAFHCTLDDGRFPTDSYSRIQWQGFDGSAIESLGCVPIDAGRAESFLAIAKTLSDAMSLDRVPTVVFAHWPGRECYWYEDMRRIAAYGSVLGKFVTINEYFDETSSAGRQCHYRADQYRSPYLKQDVNAGRRDPISRWVRYFGRRAKLDAGQTLDVLTVLCGGKGECIKKELGHRIEDVLVGDEAADTTLDADLATAIDKRLAGFASSLTGVASSSKRGPLVVNPLSVPQQACVSAPNPASCSVPALGFRWIDADNAASPAPIERKSWFGRTKTKQAPPLAEANLLRNEFCEIHFDPATGAIRSISDYHSRHVRLAQQIALRTPCCGDPDADANYTIMAADEIVVTSKGPVLGEIVCRGRLMDRNGERVAGFRQTTRVWLGSRAVEMLIDLDVERQPGANPWESYYAARFAWKDEAATIRRSVGLANLGTELTQFESPHFVDICSGEQRTTLLCGGLPYHRRLGLRKLDTPLVVQGETARSFRLGIGIDVPNPTAAALEFMSPVLVLADQAEPPTTSGWLFHLDCRNVVATHWETPPFIAGNSREPTARGDNAGRTVFRVRLFETDGRGVMLGLRCFRPVASAKKINPGDTPPVNLKVEGDKVNIPIGPRQWIEVEVALAARG